MFNLKVYLACSSLATWHWGWTCASSLFNNGWTQWVRQNCSFWTWFSHFLVFTCNSFACILSLHGLCLTRALTMWVLHVFGSYYVYTYFFLSLFLIGHWGLNDLFYLMDHFPLMQKLFTTKSFLFLFFYVFLLWLINCLLHWCVCCGFLDCFKEVIVSSWLIRKMQLSDNRTAVLSSGLQHSFLLFLRYMSAITFETQTILKKGCICIN